MRSSLRVIRFFGIDIEIHVTFFLLVLLFYVLVGLKGIVLVFGVFICVTVHELCHSLVAMRYGVRVKKITLLPIGGMASMTEMPKNPIHEAIISAAGPLSNILIIAVFYLPLYMIFGGDANMSPFRVINGDITGVETLLYVYWINVVIAGFNLIPAFPMDGGRIVRALLSKRIGHKKATEAAVRMGHIFALFFGYLGIVYGHLILLVIAVFIYISATSEINRVYVKDALKGVRVGDIVSHDFVQVGPADSIESLKGMALHSRLDEYIVFDGEKVCGFVDRDKLLYALENRDPQDKVDSIMEHDALTADVNATVSMVQKMIIEMSRKALPVEREGAVVGVITLNDIERVYAFSKAMPNNNKTTD